MKIAAIDQLATLPEEEAVQRYFDGTNWRMLRWILGAALLFAILLIPSLAASKRQPHQIPLALVHAGVAITMLVVHRRPLVERHFRAILLAYILVEFLLTISIFFGYPVVPLVSLLFFPPIMLFLRLRFREYLLLGFSFFIPNVLVALTHEMSAKQFIGQGLIAPLSVQTAYVAIGYALARSDRKRFVIDWSAVAAREIERQRMRQELDVARKIQLAMLPDAPPAVSWIEIASVSTPATEVGGDFYDYYELADGRLAIVIGDVAGHGVSSGLVLSAVKSGLYLLREDLADPDKGIAALNDMVRGSIRWRMLVSLSIVIADRERARINVISAGHPPLLLRSARSGEVVAIGADALPLGTNLPVRYSAVEAEIATGDVMLLVTDGVIEAARDGEIYGEERVAELLRNSQPDSMRALVARLEQDVQTFTGGVSPSDDITIVAARFT